MWDNRRVLRIGDQLVPNVGVNQALARLRMWDCWPDFIIARWTGLRTAGHEPWTFTVPAKKNCIRSDNFVTFQLLA